MFLPILSFTSPGPKYGQLQKGSVSPANPCTSEARQVGHHLPLTPCSGKELVGFSLCQSPWPACANSRQGLLLTESACVEGNLSHATLADLPFPPTMFSATNPSLNPSLTRSSPVSYRSISIGNSKSHAMVDNKS